ncbi:MAG: 2-hydroxyacid dehydrogenase [Mycobacteriales bacterium]
MAVTRKGLPGDGVGRLAQRNDVRVWEGETPPTAEELAQHVAGAEAILAIGADVIDDALLDAAGPQLRVVALSSMGYDAVDLDAVRRHGVVATHTPNVLAETTADLAFALMLMARRRLLDAIDDLRAGNWRGLAMDGYLGLDVYGATLGILGYGQIGRALARRARGFGMPVQFVKPRSMSDEDAAAGPDTAVDRDTLLRTSDIVSVHVPLSDATRGMIGAAEFAQMKPTATVVNTARGGIVDEADLIVALRSGAIHSAGLDVMADEPRSDSADPLLNESRLVVLPHVGSATATTRARMAGLAADNITAVLADADAPTPIPGTSAAYR